MNWDYLQPVKIHFGKGRVKEIKEIARELGCERGLLVAGPFFFKSGLAEKVIKESEGMIVASFGDVSPNPDVAEVDACAEVIRQKNIGFVVALGGGSPMDCAKAAASVALTPDSIRKYHGTGVAMPEKHLPLIAVPTTAGTGSETTLAAVITDADTHHKYAINDFNLIPDYAVLEPSVTYGLPPQLTATTGMDALTHAIEAYIGRSTTKQTRAASIEAIQLIFDNLQTAYKNGNDKTARRNMLRASYLAGTAFTKSYVGYVHAVAHSLGGCYGIPHGLANSVLLPIVLKAYGTAAHKKLARLARITGISDSKLDAVAAEEFINHIRNMNISMNIPETLDGIRNEDIPKLACYADKEANPLYPVPALWGPEKLEQMYHLVQEVNENDRNRNSEHPGKAA